MSNGTTLRPANRCRMASWRASTADCVTSASTSTCSPTSRRHARSSKNGGSTTTPTDRTRALTGLHRLSSQHAPHQGITGTDSPYKRGQVGEQVRKAHCTCTSSASIFDVVAKVRGIDFEAAKIAVAEMVGRSDLIRSKKASGKRNGRGRNSRGDNTATAQPPGCTLAAYAAAKHLPVEFLRSLGIPEIPRSGTPAVRIPYLDESGAEAALRFRVALDDKDR